MNVGHDQRSACCSATFHITGSDEGTNYYVCDGCGKGCDPAEQGGNDRALREAAYILRKVARNRRERGPMTPQPPESVPGPAQPPLVPGHLGQPSAKIVDAARTVLGACLLLEEMGVDMVQTRLAAVKRLPDMGLRERQLVRPGDSVEVREREIGRLEDADVASLARGGPAVPRLDISLAVTELARRQDD